MNILVQSPTATIWAFDVITWRVELCVVRRQVFSFAPRSVKAVCRTQDRHEMAQSLHITCIIHQYSVYFRSAVAANEGLRNIYWASC